MTRFPLAFPSNCADDPFLFSKIFNAIFHFIPHLCKSSIIPLLWEAGKGCRHTLWPSGLNLLSYSCVHKTFFPKQNMKNKNRKQDVHRHPKDWVGLDGLVEALQACLLVKGCCLKHFQTTKCSFKCTFWATLQMVKLVLAIEDLENQLTILVVQFTRQEEWKVW